MTNGAVKKARVLAALENREPDQVPIGEFFWTNFVRRAAAELGGGKSFNPYHYWDLDLIVVNPNMDPHIGGIRVLEQGGDRKLVKTGFGATIEMRGSCPMPYYLDFDTKSYDQMAEFRFDDPRDERRFFHAIDDQINAVGDALNQGYPSFVDRVNACAPHYCVFGSVCEPHEMIWRIMGTENVLLKIGEDPDKVAAFIERIGDFSVGIAEAQIKAAEGKLAGLYIWGDIAYDRGMFFSPDYWRAVYKPQLARLCKVAHDAGLKTIYHGCGNASAVFDDIRDAGVDAYNPLEAKAGLDVVDLKRRYGSGWAFNGNIDVRVLATNDRDLVRAEVLTKLNAARGGGYILQSDHSIPDNVDPKTYDYVVRLTREYGKYPLDLGEFNRTIG
ncbi:MAG TPA: uroporphyrinogen decarboxylase family protein [Candidatus Bathyarchaeia archaeon]|nr:uroporphyrinogen decarboxylase family protein [Candidatus Bathyarchaeia archaeon]